MEANSVTQGIVKSLYKLTEGLKLIIITLFRLALLRLSATGLRHCVEVQAHRLSAVHIPYDWAVLVLNAYRE